MLGVHESPSVQATQLPALQTWFVPHEVPLVRLVLESMHTELPVAHEVMPLWHALVGTQVKLAVQEVQLPPLQTLLVPHD